MRIACVLLDFGGTLAHEVPSRAEIYAAAARAEGLEIDAERMGALMDAAHRALPCEIDGAWRYSDRWFGSFVEHVFEGGLGLEHARARAVLDHLLARFSDAATFRIFPGARELLAALAEQGVRTGVVSNWSPRLAPLLARLGLAEHLDAVVSSAVERVEKPDPAIFELALRRLGVAADQALYVGDHLEKDIAGARAAGLQALLFDPFGRRGDVPDVPRIGSLLDVVEHLRCPA